ncbi:hypothetical protein D9619_005125 [Psilocybe cf. subviscida]|uniref:Uncharacterized protein n=1 Tax=Psilocybe cf. subviscida TaxID=2480587 RepID=A0A8H5BQP1_9AGAR|nr:hypothetical protein D9619_005125 [Psilocybe cf. subviscida]
MSHFPTSSFMQQTGLMDSQSYILFYSGDGGLELLTQISIANMTTQKWRGLVSGLISLPLGTDEGRGTASSPSSHPQRSHRSSSPSSEPSARLVNSISLRPMPRPPGTTGRGRAAAGRRQLILLPITLNNTSTTSTGGWNNSSMIPVLTAGYVLIPAHIFCKFKFAKHPVVARRVVFNPIVVIAFLVVALYFVSVYIYYAYLLHRRADGVSDPGWCGNTRFVSKPIIIVGLAICVLYCGLMIYSRGADAADGFGSGFAAVSLRVSAQAAVPHADGAVVTSLVLLITEIGGAIGTTICMFPLPILASVSAIFAHSHSDSAPLFGSIYGAAQFPRCHLVREGVILTYDDVIKILTIVEKVFGAVPLVISFWIPNWYLGDQQNAVDDVYLSGERVGNPDVDGERRKRR